MGVYLNESSLQGQFSTAEEFLKILQNLLKARCHDTVKHSFFVCRNFNTGIVYNNVDVRNILFQSRNTDLRRLALSWIDRNGPFTDDARLSEDNDYFECYGIDVTENGLGEAARRKIANDNAFSFSFIGGVTNFQHTPLTVDHGLAEEPLGKYEIENIWEVDKLIEVSKNIITPPESWRELTETARLKFDHLTLPDTIFENPTLKREPFDSIICSQTMRLLGILNDYAKNRSPNGEENETARSICREFFTGDRALFSDESETNKRKFESDLTFSDPENSSLKILGSWHGKISRRYFRLHFQWPMPTRSKKLKIFYLGPKVTKD